jgi:hypothetical protein
VVTKVKQHVGRLKAGWLSSWRFAGAPEGNNGSVPQFVLQHERAARGYYIDGLGIPGGPSITLVNYAKGATAENCGYLVQRGVAIRAKAMIADLQLYVRGIKKVGHGT